LGGHDKAVETHFGRVSGRYEALHGTFPLSWIRRREADATAQMLGSIAGEEVLDLGCGSGAYTRLCLSLGCARVTAVDRAPEMIARLPQSDSILGVVADAASFEPAAPFRRIVCAGMLEFVPDGAQTLARMRDRATDDAQAVLVVPSKGLTGALYTGYHRSHGVRVRCFTPSGLRGDCLASGWTLDAWRYVWPLVYVCAISASTRRER
jgi:2-polyprenyl-3-methyl-5-hydroxy-6-metoxy-1,4-benzoquinol methylase